MLWDFHGLIIEGIWDDEQIGERWRATFASRPPVVASGRSPTAPDLSFRLALEGEAPPAPSGRPDFEQGDVLAYYVQGTDPATQGRPASRVVAHFPRFGQLRLDLSHGITTGAITPAAFATHGVFEDLLAIGLSPHLRRRGMYLIHAFAAAAPPPLSANSEDGGAGRRVGVLLVGDIGAGKTTTGLALLHAGWKLLSNDSPILTLTPNASSALQVLSYPGLLSAYPDTLARFPELGALNTAGETRQKVLFAAESVYREVWIETAAPAALLFPHLEPRQDHALERLSAPEALRLILPHAVEQWDREMIPAHLALLNQLVKATPAYRLRLGSETNTIPAAIASALEALR